MRRAPAKLAGVFLAEWETRSFSWRGVGETREAAVAALAGAWRVHCGKEPAADPTLCAEEEVEVTLLEVGTGWQDDRVVFRTGER